MKMTDSQIFTIGYIKGLLAADRYMPDAEKKTLIDIQALLATDGLFDSKIVPMEEGE
jgi:hypothetical protein